MSTPAGEGTRTTSLGATSKDSESLPRGQLIRFAIAPVGITAMAFVNALYLFKYSTDVLLIAPGVMGVIYFIGRVWDAITDPLVGRLSDRTRSPLGRRRVWIFASIPATAGAFGMLWAPPGSLSTSALAFWIGTALLLFSTAQTMFMVPHFALGVEMSDAHHERTRIFGFRQLVGGAGLLLGMFSFFGLATAEDPRAFAPWMAIALPILAALAILAGIGRLRERTEFQDRGGETLVRAFWDVFRNPHARRLLLMYGIESFGPAASGILSVYVTQYVVKVPQQYYLIVLLLHVGPAFALAPLWTRLSRRIGKRRLWYRGTIVAAIAYTLHSFLAEGTFVFWCLISVVQGATSGLAQVVGPSLKADVIDWDELQSGERKEGAYMAAWTFMQKAAGGLCGIFVGFALQTVGFEPNVEQSETTQWTILALYGALPGAAYAVGAWLLSRFELDERTHQAVRAELEVRRRGSR